MSENKNNLAHRLIREKRFHIRLVLKGLLAGCVAGFSVGLFRYLLEAGEYWRPQLYRKLLWAAGDGQWLSLATWVLALIVIAWVLAYIIRREPMCTGSGIPQVKGILQGQLEMQWLSVMVCKIIGGVLAIGAGMSLGREGPSVQIGACSGQAISRRTKRTRYEERILLTAGAGAGLAAAFNAPLAGVIFGLEELQKHFSASLLLAGITASVTATAITELIFGAQPVFTLGEIAVLPLSSFWAVIGTGLFIGILAQGFNRGLFFSMRLYERLGLRGMKAPLIPLLLAGVLGFILPEILGGGNLLVDSFVYRNYALEVICFLFVTKFLFTMLCFGSRVPGGIFLPMLVLGAAAGAFLGRLLIDGGWLGETYFSDMIILGMAAYFAAVVKSPVTGSILIMEMTGSFQHMLPLIAVSLIAYIVSDLLGGKPVYDELLEHSLNK